VLKLWEFRHIASPIDAGEGADRGFVIAAFSRSGHHWSIALNHDSEQGIVDMQSESEIASGSQVAGTDGLKLSRRFFMLAAPAVLTACTTAGGGGSYGTVSEGRVTLSPATARRSATASASAGRARSGTAGPWWGARVPGRTGPRPPT
jgi:hypothetical protein